MAGEVEKSADELRLEGALEVLEYLRQYEIVNYSIPEDLYFMRVKDQILFLPWRRKSQDVG